MNGTYYPNPTFPNNMNNYQPEQEISTNLPMEQSYIENILRLNIGKKAKVFASFPDSTEWRDRIYDGIIEQAGKDHLVMSSPSLGDWYLIPMIYVNWVEFEEPINFKVF
ncbi:MAG: spore coat protein GerQ [Erysipelotrichales bacterium]|nr:spore coat protein GerQ [Erysipelotrichales bacterium]